MKYIVVLDTPSIKKYVFESSALKEIRGASAILDNLNRLLEVPAGEPKKIINDIYEYQESKYKEFVESIQGLKLDQFIFANGGSGLIIIETQNSALLEKLAFKFEKLYQENTKGAISQLIGWAEYESEDCFTKSLREAHWYLRRKRSKNSIIIVPNTPWVRYDQGLKNHRAEILFKGYKDAVQDDKYQWVSDISFTRKKEADGYRRIWEELKNFLGFEIKPPVSLDDIAKKDGSQKGKENKIAIVYADGNAMGKEIKQIKSPQKYAEFSKKVDEAVREATFASLKDLFVPQKGAYVRFDIILLGGDDILIVLPPEYASDFVIKANGYFLEKTQGKYSLSFGISVANNHSPFDKVVGQASECLKNAKKAIKKGPGVDFHVNCSGFFPDVNQYRNQEYSNEELKLKLCCRPFSINTFKKYLNKTSELKQSNVAASRLYQIGNSLKKGKNRGHIGWITGVTRARTLSQKKALQNLLYCWLEQNGKCEIYYDIEPWRKDEEESKFTCGFHDILELYDLVKKNLGEIHEC